eukprot:scaffold64867_cov35-Tisochrysis_lutea.AAC.2
MALAAAVGAAAVIQVGQVPPAPVAPPAPKQIVAPWLRAEGGGRAPPLSLLMREHPLDDCTQPCGRLARLACPMWTVAEERARRSQA